MSTLYGLAATEGQAARALSFIVASRRALVFLTLAYIALGVFILVEDLALHDEGLFTVDWAIWASRDFAPVFFYQKAKPVLALLYLAPSLGGDRACLLAHLLVAAAAIPVIASAARALGITTPNVAAVAVAASPIYFLGGASGVSNTDGVVATSLVIAFMARRRFLSAGLVLGLLPWIRHELALFALVIVLHGVVVERDRRIVVGALAFPLVYGLAGALYHHDALWLLHFPPTTPQPMPNNPVWEPVNARQLAGLLLAVTPLFGIAFAVRWKKITALERTLFLYAVAWLTIAAVLPVWRIANFGFVPRYALVVLPMLSLLTARAASTWSTGEPSRPIDALVAGTYAVLMLAVGQSAATLGLFMVIAWTVTISIASRPARGRLGVLGVLAIAASGPLLPVRTEMSRAEFGAYLPDMVAWLRQNHSADDKRPIFTNSPLLALYARDQAGLIGLDVRFLVGLDQQYDLVSLSDEANGQRAALLRLAAGHFNGGTAILPSELAPENIPDGSLFALRHDRRVDALLPDALWSAHLHPIAEGTFRGLRFSR